MIAIEQCRLHIAPKFSDWDFALRAARDSQINFLLGLISFITRVNDISHRASEPSLATTQLQWWRAQLDASSNVEFDALNTARHPSLTALGDKVTLPTLREKLHRLINLAEEDVGFSGFAAHDDMTRFFRTRGAITVELHAAVCDVSVSGEIAARVGYFLEYCDLLEHFARYGQSGVVYFAADDLEAHGWTDESIVAKNACDNQDKWFAFFSQQTALATASLSADLRNIKSALPVLSRFIHLRRRWLEITAQHGYPLCRYHIQLGSLQKRLICLQSDWF